MTAPNGNAGYVATWQDTFESFTTFCLEDNEYFASGKLYDTEISTSATNGGSGGQDGFEGANTIDSLSTETAWLYSQFSKPTGGLLASIGFDKNNSSHRSAVQKLVWHYEDENSGVAPNLTTPTTMLDKLGVLVDGHTTAGSGNLFNVRVMRLFFTIANDPGDIYGYGIGGNAQDQLIIIPMPAPMAMAGAGLLGLGMLRRRR